MRGWMVSLGLAGLAVAAAMVVHAFPSTDAGVTAAPDASIETDPCFRYGRFECCVRGDE